MSLILKSLPIFLSAATLLLPAAGESERLSSTAVQKADVRHEYSSISHLRQRLWREYLGELEKNPLRLQQHRANTLQYRDKQMKYFCEVVGEKPAGGRSLYICLHGGGGVPSAINDLQWQQMQRYYKTCVEEGVYVAPRGVSNTWGLHFVDESYVLYDRLIENMIAFEGVNPDKVYLLGFSAGGDAVYQLAPRMADRWAAVNMSAGHPNDVSPLNLSNLPMLLQVGENDAMYKRNRAAAEYKMKLQQLQKDFPGSYQHELFLHTSRGHNFTDNDPQNGEYQVIDDIEGWLRDGTAPSRREKTSAISWVQRYRRNSRPVHVRWDLATRAPSRSAQPEKGFAAEDTRSRQFYWLQLDDSKADQGMIDGEYNRGNNTITIHQAAADFTVLLDEQMIDYRKAVKFIVEGEEISLSLKPNVKIMKRTLLQRGDLNYCFFAAVSFSRTEGGNWLPRQQ